MADKRNIIVYIATSADGYIARADGSVDWLDRPRPKGDYGMAEFQASIDTILYGRKTLFPKGFPAKVAKGKASRSKVKHYVFSRTPPDSSLPGPPGVEVVREPIGDFATRLRAMPGKDIWMMGGAGIIGSFLDEGEIDAFILHVIPVFIGEGIPLIAPRRRQVPLVLESTQQYDDGVVRLHYSVARQRMKSRM